MPSDRDKSSAADVVFTAVSPALIMLMVGSLVFFLITVLPTGDYKERLHYTTFFFVFGAVLVARIAIQFDAGRAAMYGLGLAIATFIAMNAFVEYPSGTGLKSFGWLLNLGFMALIWWSATSSRGIARTWTRTAMPPVAGSSRPRVSPRTTAPRKKKPKPILRRLAATRRERERGQR